MKIKVSEATPLQLNWAVASTLGEKLVFFDAYFTRSGLASGTSQTRIDSMLAFQPLRGQWCYLNSIGGCVAIPNYCEGWNAGGPIIEREKITLDPFDDSPNWCATIPGYMYRVYGPTPLIAAMRCYVASKLGDVVEIPEELS